MTKLLKMTESVLMSGSEPFHLEAKLPSLAFHISPICEFPTEIFCPQEILLNELISPIFFLFYI